METCAKYGRILDGSWTSPATSLEVLMLYMLVAGNHGRLFDTSA